MGKRNTLLELVDKAIALEPEEFSFYRLRAMFLQDFRKFDEAIEWLDKAIAVRSDQADLYCKKGVLLNRLGQTAKAVECFRTANELVLTNLSSTVLIPPSTIDWIKTTLKSCLDLQDIAKETEDQINKLDQKNPTTMKYIKKMKDLAGKNEEATKALLGQYGQNNSEVEKLKQEIDKLKSEFATQLRLVQEDISSVKSDVKELNNKYESLKVELSTKMDDFKKKLDLELSKKDLQADQIITIKEYFNAFVETFCSLYVTSQVIESGQIQLDAGDNLTSLLSTVASFSPFFGDALSKGVSSISEFFKTKQMKANAKQMLTLASDSSDLSQIVGGVAYDIIVKYPQKQTQILEITDNDLQEKSKSTFLKILDFCKQLGEAKDAYLYGKLYKTAAARLGHMDANKLIEFWMKEFRIPYGINTEFIKILVTDLTEAEKKTESETPALAVPAPKSSRTACCNVF